MAPPAQESMDISVVIPTLNEAVGAPPVVARLKTLFSDNGISHEILVVDGGSSDGTQELARAAGAHVLHCPVLGYGPAFRQGVQTAQGEFIITMDGDGSHPPDTALDLWRRRHDADVVIGSRYVPGGSALMPLHRLALSRMLNVMTRVFYGFAVQDASGGMRIYRASYLKSIATSARDFSIQQEILARALSRGAKVEEIPLQFRPRSGGRSKASALNLGVSYLKLFFRIKSGALKSHP
ncbi:MAG TPA: glycosyltransferase [Elusimicrobiota bacterium]|nr:glycosyltransferase [Elusimicrobiota bacterium]